VIAFIGLLAPHIARRLVGSDHRLLTPLSCLVGAILLLGADTLGRVLVGSGALPVGVITSFMGAPLFLFLLLRGAGRR
jgi:iron complex transport system permease protein